MAPYTIVNLVAGASHIRFRDYFIGTLLGMTPGICSLALVGDGLVRAVRAPSPATVGVLFGLVVLLVVAAWYARVRLADRREHESDEHRADA